MTELGDDPDVLDAAERTGLAWGRSGLALIACVAILARRFFPPDTRADHVVAFLLLGGAGLGWAITASVGRRRAMATGTSPASSARRLALITVFTTAIAVAGFVLSLFPHPV
jgi:uncharacterized membrane protein YidH (DUF202 family)